MPRKVFFSFHYDDVTRVNVVRNSDQITRRYTKAARFHDKSLWEEAKKQGPLAIKRMINGGLDGSSVTCVLIGSHTWQRPWVRYEIIKSLARGNGILGVRIHDVGFKPGQPTNALAGLFGTSPPSNALTGYGSRSEPTLGGLLGLAAQRPAPSQNALFGALLAGEQSLAPTPQPGPNPLRYLGYTVDRRYGLVRFHEVGPNGQWREHAEVQSVPLRSLPWLPRLKDADNLENLFRIYDWKQNYGSFYFPTWIEEAAAQVGR